MSITYNVVHYIETISKMLYVAIKNEFVCDIEREYISTLPSQSSIYGMTLLCSAWTESHRFKLSRQFLIHY
jgi:hypothetical protein